MSEEPQITVEQLGAQQDGVVYVMYRQVDAAGNREVAGMVFPNPQGTWCATACGVVLGTEYADHVAAVYAVREWWRPNG